MVIFFQENVCCELQVPYAYAPVHEMLYNYTGKFEYSATSTRGKTDSLITIRFLINMQVQGHHTHQWAPFQVTGEDCRWSHKTGGVY